MAARRPRFQLEPSPVYTEDIGALLDTDPASASHIFNPLFLAVLHNVKAVKQMVESQLSQDVLSGLEAKADRSQLAELTSDLAQIAFQLHLRDLVDAQGMDFVIPYEFATAGALTLLHGRWAGGKAFI